jgi:hypothetical protein
MVSLRNESETLAALIEAGHFAVNVLHEGQEPLANRFASRDDEAWRGIRWTLRDGRAPVLEGALATLQCVVHDLADGGDHRIVVGRVAAVDHPDDHVPPLVFYRGNYSRLAPPPDLTRLPSRLGELAIQPLPLGVDGVTSIAVLVGEPHGTEGTLVHLHRACVVGDALHGADCPRRGALDAALERMTAAGRGVVAYHRDDRHPFSGCCLGGPAADDATARRTLELAIDQLDLRDPRVQ